MMIVTAVDQVNWNATTLRLANLVRADYAEMPGLSVTLAQAQRLWSADERTCRVVFETLIARGLLRQTANGRFVKCSSSVAGLAAD
ncbi:MAG: hypothetical protein QM736_23360 [Vicinamibacterales bacterium]